MAEVRQEREVRHASMVQCLQQQGLGDLIEIAPNRTITITIPQTLTDAEQEAYSMMLETKYEPCRRQLFADTLPPVGQAEYQQILDLRECLIHEGYDIPNPPSYATWRQQENVDRGLWTPYFAVIDLGKNRPTLAEEGRLNTVCPQPSFASAYNIN